jgi:hypothetical protein
VDPVTVTDAGLGLDAAPRRVLGITHAYDRSKATTRHQLVTLGEP